MAHILELHMIKISIYQVMVKSMVGKEEMTIKSSGEIEGVKVLGGREGAERFVVAKTNESLLIADICRGLVSEVSI